MHLIFSAAVASHSKEIEGDLMAESRNLKVPLTEAEVLQHGRELGKLSSQLAQVEAEEKDVRAQYKAKKESISSRMQYEAKLVNNGYEFRDVECEVRFNEPVSGEKSIIRLDTGDVVSIERMTPREMQPPLFDSDEEEAESDETTESESQSDESAAGEAAEGEASSDADESDAEVTPQTVVSDSAQSAGGTFEEDPAPNYGPDEDGNRVRLPDAPMVNPAKLAGALDDDVATYGASGVDPDEVPKRRGRRAKATAEA
jgi:hypothetical protein